uniref:VHS domain-containing protein n=1 Tax=Vitrella brassicaformis TaxID=1169539 RepID=A0A7S1KG40_9ALVE|mmetsp:Transcript_52752/g.132595  ORF Transcript_52752/g.132595 Transcript_52752/m.132595 type:complete len:718 (+) Transcript_52752:174-2327(+)
MSVAQQVRAALESRQTLDAQLQSLVNIVAQAGPDAARASINQLHVIIKDKNEPTKTKILAVELIDTLVSVDENCGKCLIESKLLKRLLEIARRKNERGMAKKKASYFGSNAQDSEVSQCIDAAGRAIQHWGMLNTASTSERGKHLRSAWETLINEGISIPHERQADSLSRGDQKANDELLKQRLSAAMSSAELVQETLVSASGPEMKAMLDDIVQSLRSDQQRLQEDANSALDAGHAEDFEQISKTMESVSSAIVAYDQWTKRQMQASPVPSPPPPPPPPARLEAAPVASSPQHSGAHGTAGEIKPATPETFGVLAPSPSAAKNSWGDSVFPSSSAPGTTLNDVAPPPASSFSVPRKKRSTSPADRRKISDSGKSEEKNKEMIAEARELAPDEGTAGGPFPSFNADATGSTVDAKAKTQLDAFADFDFFQPAASAPENSIRTTTPPIGTAAVSAGMDTFLSRGDETTAAPVAGPSWGFEQSPSKVDASDPFTASFADDAAALPSQSSNAQMAAPLGAQDEPDAQGDGGPSRGKDAAPFFGVTPAAAQGRSGVMEQDSHLALRRRIESLETQLEVAEAALRPKIESEVRSEVQLEMDNQRREMRLEVETLQKRLDASETGLNLTKRELDEVKGRAQALTEDVKRYEQIVGDRENAVSHAKEMWLRESSRAATLSDKLDAAEQRIANQESDTVRLTERYVEATQELRQLKHLFGNPVGE